MNQKTEFYIEDQLIRKALDVKSKAESALNSMIANKHACQHGFLLNVNLLAEITLSNHFRTLSLKQQRIEISSKKTFLLTWALEGIFNQIIQSDQPCFKSISRM